MMEGLQQLQPTNDDWDSMENWARQATVHGKAQLSAFGRASITYANRMQSQLERGIDRG